MQVYSGVGWSGGLVLLRICYNRHKRSGCVASRKRTIVHRGDDQANGVSES